MNFKENKEKTLAKIYAEYPDAISADLIRFRENIGFWVTLKSGAAIFYKLIEPIKYTSPNRCLFGLFGE